MGKIKVYELAKELDMSSKSLMERLDSMDIKVKSHLSVLENEDAEKAKKIILLDVKKQDTKIVKAERPEAKAKEVEKKGNIPPEKTKAAQTVKNGAAEKSADTAKEAAKPAMKKEKTAEKQPVRGEKRSSEQLRAEGARENQSRNRMSGTGGKREGGVKRENDYRREGDGRRENIGRSNAGKEGDHRRADNRRDSGQGRGPSSSYSGKEERRERPQKSRDHAKDSMDTGLEKKTSNRREKENKYKEKNKYIEHGEGKNTKKRKNDKRSEKEFQPLDLKKTQKGKASKYKQQKLEKQQELEVEQEVLPEGTIVINVPITVAGFAEQVETSISQVIMTLMKLGIMANMNQNIDEETVVILAEEMGIDVAIGNVEEEVMEEGIETFEDREEDLKNRPPIITVMGHVDHGKTSLLDAIRKTNVTITESGGITQHIGASEVVVDGQKIVFLDTPGHEAFTAMRARGAHVTDIAVLVVAADDSVKPQTIESISHAKAAGVPIIVAINKMDKPGANPDIVKKDLTEHGILVEDWGGDTISVPVSAKTGDGIDNLLEMILLQAEVLELKANPLRRAHGTVVEARLDKSKGPVATLLVLNGTLKTGDSVVAGTCSGRIRAMTNFKGEIIKKAMPGTAVEILGLTDVPEAGDEFHSVKDDRLAREIAESRKDKLREEIMARNSSTTLEKLFSQIQEGEEKILNLIIKGDVQGSVGALITSLEKLKNENVRVKIIHSGVGTVTESDIMLANTAGAVIIAFNVRPRSAISALAENKGIEIRTYRVIYDVIDDVEAAMKGMLDPVFKEVVLGKIEIRETFKVPGIGVVGGAYVTEGKVQRNADVRLVRDGIVIHEGKISSLKRFKDDVKEVNQGYECGIGLENYNDIKIGDEIEAFKMEEIERK